MSFKQPEYCSVLGVHVTVGDMDSIKKCVLDNIEELRGKYICVSNVHTTVTAYENRNYRRVQNGAAMVFPDGGPLSIVCRLRGYKNASRVTGPDFMGEIFKEKGVRQFFYGSTPETLDKLRGILEKEHPDIQICGMYSPPFRTLSPQEDEEIVGMINAAKPDIVWIGLGAPKQENWMAKHEGRINAVMVGVGAGFDYFAGNIKRAPMIMQKLSLEWLYRLVQEPKRLYKRYFSTNTVFLIANYRLWMQYRKIKKRR